VLRRSRHSGTPQHEGASVGRALLLGKKSSYLRRGGTAERSTSEGRPAPADPAQRDNSFTTLGKGGIYQGWGRLWRSRPCFRAKSTRGRLWGPARAGWEARLINVVTVVHYTPIYTDGSTAVRSASRSDAMGPVVCRKTERLFQV